jgi:hypothetical protein
MIGVYSAKIARNGLESIRRFYESILRTTRKRALPLIIRS